MFILKLPQYANTPTVTLGQGCLSLVPQVPGPSRRSPRPLSLCKDVETGEERICAEYPPHRGSPGIVLLLLGVPFPVSPCLFNHLITLAIINLCFSPSPSPIRLPPPQPHPHSLFFLFSLSPVRRRRRHRHRLRLFLPTAGTETGQDDPGVTGPTRPNFFDQQQQQQ